MRKYYWYISTFMRKRGVIVLVSIIAAILVFSLGLPFLSRFFELNQHRYIGMVGRYTLTTLPRSIQNEISSGLTAISEDGTPIPALAERWVSEDNGLSYRFVLKKNLTWQDGKPFTPSDVNYSFPDVQVATTANDVIFKLKTPFVPFPTAVAQPLFRVSDEPYFIFFKRKKIIGLGDYRVLDYTEQNQRLTQLVINSSKDQKIYRFYLTEDDAISAMKRGEVDILENFSTEGDLSDWPNLDITRRTDPQTYLAVFFNTSSPLFRCQSQSTCINEFRQALSYATPKPTDATRAFGPISANSWAYANVGKSYDYDQERAIERLLVALPGFNEPISFELVTPPLFQAEAEQIKKSWEELGKAGAERCLKDTAIKEKNLCQNLNITVNLRINSFPDTDNFQTMLVGQTNQSDPDQYALWHSDQPTNFTHYKNVRIDSLVEKGRQTEDKKTRTEIYQDFQQFFSEDAPVIFLRQLERFDIRRKGK